MVLTYSSKSDGWDYTTFHEKLDRQGASLVVLITKDNEVVGGYNPKGENIVVVIIVQDFASYQLQIPAEHVIIEAGEALQRSR